MTSRKRSSPNYKKGLKKSLRTISRCLNKYEELVSKSYGNSVIHIGKWRKKLKKQSANN